MQFEVNVEKLINHSISIQDLLFCHIVYNSDRKIMDFYIEQFDKFFNKESLDILVKKNMIYLEDNSKGYIFNNIKVTDLFIETFIEEPIVLKKAKKTEDEPEWFAEWFELWPKGVRSGGYLVRGDRKGCIKKIQKFIKEYPEFNKDIIIKATKDYIDSFRMKRSFDYMKLSHFFIYKDNMSTLAGFCELIKEKLDNGTYKEIDNRFDRIDNIDDI